MQVKVDKIYSKVKFNLEEVNTFELMSYFLHSCQSKKNILLTVSHREPAQVPGNEDERTHHLEGLQTVRVRLLGPRVPGLCQWNLSCWTLSSKGTFYYCLLKIISFL